MPTDGALPALTRTLVLVGLSGSGKSTVAPLLADRLGVPALDLDRRIEADAGRSVSEVFAVSGEAEFRRLETVALGEVLGEPPAVLAAGGGLVCSPAARSLLGEHAVVVWLDASDHELLGRLQGAGEVRPLLRDDPATTLRRLRREREAWYAEVADLRLDVDGLDPEQVVDDVLDQLRVIGATL